MTTFPSIMDIINKFRQYEMKTIAGARYFFESDNDLLDLAFPEN